MDVFEKPIEFLKGIGPGRAKILAKELDIKTFRDLLFFFPYRYVDRSKFHLINNLNESNIDAQIKGKFLNTKVIQQKKGKRFSGTFSDGISNIELIWFFQFPLDQLERYFLLFYIYQMLGTVLWRGY